MKKSVKGSVTWRVTYQYDFLCPDCGQWLPAGNPLKCPHQDGPLATFGAQSTDRDHLVQPEHPQAPPSPSPTTDLIEAMSGCAKGG